MTLWEKWRPWLKQERQLLTELALMLLVALVVGVYFLENFSGRLEAEQRTQLKALAGQTALRAAESLADEDLIGLNVIARETRDLGPVTGVGFADLSGEPVTSKGDLDAPLSVQMPVALPDGELAGTVTLTAEPALGARQRLEAGFVLVVLGLLALRVAAEVARRRVWRPVEPEADGVADTGPAHDAPWSRHTGTAGGSVASPAGPAVELRLSVVNFDHFQQRYTRAALDRLVDDYRALLVSVVGLYGGEVVSQIGDRARVRFAGEPLSGSAFNALCAGLLFLRVARLQGPRRKAAQTPALEFKALVSGQFGEEESWALCLAGVPGRLHVPDTELTRAELDVKALYQTDKALVMQAGERQVRLQPVEQLAHRYQTLLRTQAEKVMAGGSESGDPGVSSSPSK